MTVICHLDPIRDRAVIAVQFRFGAGVDPVVRSHRCIRIVADPAERPMLEVAMLQLLMRQLTGGGWEEATGR